MGQNIKIKYKDANMMQKYTKQQVHNLIRYKTIPHDAYSDRIMMYIQLTDGRYITKSYRRPKYGLMSYEHERSFQELCTHNIMFALNNIAIKEEITCK